MSSAIEDVWAALVAALRGVEGLRVYDDPGAVIDPPGVVLGPPTLTWDVFASAPTQATFTAAFASVADDRALSRLFDLLPAVTEAVDSVTGAAVQSASPGELTTAGTGLPAYLIEIEVSL